MVSRDSPGAEGRAELSFVWAACGATCALRCGIYIGWTFDEVMLDGDLAWEGCARNSGVVNVIETQRYVFDRAVLHVMASPFHAEEHSAALYLTLVR